MHWLDMHVDTIRCESNSGSRKSAAPVDEEEKPLLQRGALLFLPLANPETGDDASEKNF
jgi:hypothetical protein